VPARPRWNTGSNAGATRSNGERAIRTLRSAYDRALFAPRRSKRKAPETFQVKFTTTRGEFTVTVHRAWAPIGADRFYNLVKHHFYDNAASFAWCPASSCSLASALSACFDRLERHELTG